VSKVVAFTNVTLDSVMQAPGSPDEDRRDGFEHGGWATPYAAMSQAGGSMGQPGALLFGRLTYEQFYEVWPKRKDSPFSAMLDNMTKYVASRTLNDPLPWMNSTLLQGDGADAVARLKKELSHDLLVLGSGNLVQSLARRNVVDEYVKSQATPNGVVIATYEAAKA
jgi:dihydrofolate reductase